jgi:hypothetical protein
MASLDHNIWFQLVLKQNRSPTMLQLHHVGNESPSHSIILAEKLMHIFSKTNDDNECRAESAQQEHRHQHMIHDLEKEMHSKSVLLSTLKA